MNSRSLTFRLVAWHSGVLLLVGMFFAAYTYVGFTYYLRNVVHDTLSTRAEDIRNLATPLLGDPVQLGVLVEKRFMPEAHDRFIKILIDGHMIYASSDPLERAFDPSGIDYRPEGQDGLRRFGRLWIYSSRTTLADGRSLLIESGQLGDTFEKMRTGFLGIVLIALPLLLGIAAYGGYRLVRRALTPVADMINAAEALTFNSPHKRIPLANTHDLIDELGRTLNRMLERLDHAYQHAKGFSADVAHELRTPLAIVRGELEFIVPRTAPAELQNSASSALDETMRLSGMVEHLLALARLEGVGGKREQVEVDLCALARSTIEQMQLLAEEKSIALTCVMREPVTLSGDRDRLKQILVNLIDNAIKHTPAGGRVRIEARQLADDVVFSVADDGIGIAQEHQDRIFDRFFRVDHDRGETGTGLGLAIVKSIAAAHGGTVSVESAPGRGSTFSVRLPTGANRSAGKTGSL